MPRLTCAAILAALAVACLAASVREAQCASEFEGQWSIAGKTALVAPAGTSCPGFDYLVTDENGQQACAKVKGTRLETQTWRATGRLTKDGKELAWSDGRVWKLVSNKAMTPQAREEECGRSQQTCVGRCNQVHLGDSVNQASCWGTCNAAFVACIGGR
jgi:hypothetical protein